jgi:ribonuclease R
VARFAEERGRRIIHRVHGSPDPERMEELFFFAKTLGLTANVKDTRQALQRIIDSARGTTLSHAVNLVILKSMKHAEYLTEGLGHYALATNHYCHFTSPIRRFPDLVVHSVLKERDLEARNRRPFKWSPVIDEYAAHSTRMEIRAEKAERELTKIKLLRFLLDRIGEVVHGVVVGVEEFGAFVELEEIPVDGLLSVRNLPGHVQHDSRRHTLNSGPKKTLLRLGDRIPVRIGSIDMERRELNLQWVS